MSLAFESTVNRRLVHRATVSEVFLTDLKQVDDRTVMIGAQLPRCHGYFNDHGENHSYVDPLLFLEVARQATLASAHALQVPTDVILISSDCNLEVCDRQAFYQHGDITAISIESSFDWTTVRRGQPRAGTCRQLISVNGAVAARHWSSGRLMSRSQLAALRVEQRGNQPPWTADMVDRPIGFALPPAIVGRHNPMNVVLAHLEAEGTQLRALISPPWKNRALFDHSYDHLTMQILIESARQLAAIAVERGTDSALSNWSMTAVAGQFKQFAELDQPTSVATTMPTLRDGVMKIHVVVTQAGQEIAVVDMAFAPGEGGRP